MGEVLTGATRAPSHGCLAPLVQEIWHWSRLSLERRQAHDQTRVPEKCLIVTMSTSSASSASSGSIKVSAFSPQHVALVGGADEAGADFATKTLTPQTFVTAIIFRRVACDSTHDNYQNSGQSCYSKATVRGGKSRVRAANSTQTKLRRCYVFARLGGTYHHARITRSATTAAASTPATLYTATM